MRTNEYPEIKNQIKVTNMIFYSLITGMVLFFIVTVIFIQGKDSFIYEEFDGIFIFIVPVFGLIMMFLSRLIYNQIIAKNITSNSLLQKISLFRTAKIVSWAMIESSCILALVATMVTSNYLYIVVFIFLLGYFILMRPSKESLVRDMQLNPEESDIILKS